MNVSRKLEENIFNNIVQNYIEGNYLTNYDEKSVSNNSDEGDNTEDYLNLHKKYSISRNSILKNYQLSSLFILYFFELARYPLTSKTLSMSYHATERNPSHWLLVIKYLDENVLE